MSAGDHAHALARLSRAHRRTRRRAREDHASIPDYLARLRARRALGPVDVREDREWDAGHLPGAIHLGKGIIERDIEKTVPDPATPVVLYCGGGFRSVLVCENLQKHGLHELRLARRRLARMERARAARGEAGALGGIAMIAELQGYALMLRTTHRLFLKSLEGVTPAQSMERHDGANPILWIAAHTVSVRGSFARGLGLKISPAWARQFARGSQVKDVTSWPSLDEVRAAWDEVHAAFMAQLETITAEQVAAKTPIAGLDDTLLGALGLAALHDAYHVGQLAAARRVHGLERIVG